jgi:hypothetical protein
MGDGQDRSYDVAVAGVDRVLRRPERPNQSQARSRATVNEQGDWGRQAISRGGISGQ